MGNPMRNANNGKMIIDNDSFLDKSLLALLNGLPLPSGPHPSLAAHLLALRIYLIDVKPWLQRIAPPACATLIKIVKHSRA
jgi:hypothetical protein